MNIISEYIKYKWKAKGRHGIHSPYVFEFVDQCLRTPFSEEDLRLIKQYISCLSKDSTTLEIKDFGAGSKRLSNLRKVKQILKTSSSKGKYGYLLYQLSKHYSFQNILELGTSLGVGTLHLHKGNPNANIITIEACPQTFAYTREKITPFCSNNIQFINDTFEHVLNQNLPVFDFVFIDGHHDGKALLHYLEKIKPYIHNETILLLDDIRWSDDMLKAWSEIISFEDYHLTIDLFRMGLISPRVNLQAKEHFTIKI